MLTLTDVSVAYDGVGRAVATWAQLQQPVTDPQNTDPKSLLGQLEIVAGRVTDMWPGNQKLGVAIKGRGKAETVEHQFALVVNCTGPLGSISASGDALIQSLFEQGLAKPDALDLGLEIDGNSRVAGAERAWAVGPLSRGKFWEITAVPDIRGQVAQVAYEIAEELKP